MEMRNLRYLLINWSYAYVFTYFGVYKNIFRKNGNTVSKTSWSFIRIYKLFQISVLDSWYSIIIHDDSMINIGSVFGYPFWGLGAPQVPLVNLPESLMIVLVVSKIQKVWFLYLKIRLFVIIDFRYFEVLAIFLHPILAC